MGAHEFVPGSGSGPVDGGVRWRPRRGIHLRAAVAMAVLLALLAAGSARSAHRVRPGDTLWEIARANGTTVQVLAEANGISNPNLIVVGQRLLIPDGRPGGPAVPAAQPQRKHTVSSGENLTLIASRYGTTVTAIVEANQLANPGLIHPGQVVIVPGPQSVEDLLVHNAGRCGVDPALVKGLAWQESGWRQDLVSKAGAVGVMQVMPETGRFISRHLLRKPVDLANVEQNVEAGTRFLAYLLELTGGDESLAVAGYFQGLRSVRSEGMSDYTKRYVANVIALKKRFS
jgi:LysM repeat protein